MDRGCRGRESVHVCRIHPWTQATVRHWKSRRKSGEKARRRGLGVLVYALRSDRLSNPAEPLVDQPRRPLKPRIRHLLEGRKTRLPALAKAPLQRCFPHRRGSPGNLRRGWRRGRAVTAWGCQQSAVAIVDRSCCASRPAVRPRAVLPHGSELPMPRRLTFVAPILGFTHSDAACASASCLRLAAYAGSRGTGSPSLSSCP